MLLTPGPVSVSPRVTRAVSRGDLHPCEPEFDALLGAVRAKLLAAFAPLGGYVAVPLTGCGTLALETAVTSAVSPGRAMLVVTNGMDGERILEIATLHGIPTRVERSAWTRPPDVDSIARTVREDPTIEVVALAHHETATGMVNPVEAVGSAVASAGRVLLVDAVGGLGGDRLDLERSGVGICVGAADACLQGLPGAGFVLAREEEMARMAKLRPRTLSLHLPHHVAPRERRTPAFGAAVQVLYALDEALSELLEETVAGRIERYRLAAEQLRVGFAELDLELPLPAELRSNSLTALRLPARVPFAELHDRLKSEGFVIGEGQGALAREVFRVANMGALGRDDFARFLDALGDALGRPLAAPADGEDAWRW
jgi:2-aminoethylphosphonate-pyruvate transaminase